MIGWSFHGFQTSLSKATHYPWVAREGWHAQERAAARYNDDKNICRRLVPRGKPEHYSYFIFPPPFVFPSSFSLILVPLFLLALSPWWLSPIICQFQREQKSKKFCRNNQSTIVVIFEFLLDRNCTIYIFNHRGSLARTIAKSKFYALWIIPRPHPQRKTNLASSRLLNEKFNLEVNKPGLTNLG